MSNNGPLPSRSADVGYGTVFPSEIFAFLSRLTAELKLMFMVLLFPSLLLDEHCHLLAVNSVLP